MPIQSATIHRPYHIKNIPNRAHVRHVQTHLRQWKLHLTIHIYILENDKISQLE